MVRRRLLARVGLCKALHWLRNNPGKRRLLVTALEHCDMVGGHAQRRHDRQRAEA